MLKVMFGKPGVQGGLLDLVLCANTIYFERYERQILQVD
jgi:hypothetical protein